jgi:hypothetical protein
VNSVVTPRILYDGLKRLHDSINDIKQFSTPEGLILLIMRHDEIVF